MWIKLLTFWGPALLLLGLFCTGILIACHTIPFLGSRRNRREKILFLAGALLLPLGILAGIWLYQGGMICNGCGSISTNICTQDPWIIRVDVCNHCVQYIDCNGTKHLQQSPPLPQICLSCQEDLVMKNEEFGEFLLFSSLLFIFGSYYLHLLGQGLFFLGQQCLRHKKKNGAQSTPS